MKPKAAPKIKLKTSLFWRILFRLTLLFFLLGAFFTAAQVANQIQTLNEIYRIESQWAFANVYKNLSEAAKDPKTFENWPAFGQKTAQWKSLYHFTEIDVFDILEHASLLNTGTPWTSEDSRILQKTFEAKKVGIPYYVTLHKDTKQLSAYFLFDGPENKIYAVRVFFPIPSIDKALTRSYRSLGAMLIFVLVAVLLIGNSLARSIVKPVQTLDRATREIMSGRLGMQVQIKTGDEIEALASTFNEMSRALEEMKSRAEDANPLTGLYGNKVIFNELQKRIHERQKFVLFHADLDRFKVFNDHYGLAKGDIAIQKTADLLKKTIKEKGAEDDFVGHQGGDDFVIITRPKQAKELSEEICRRFDSEVVASLYNKADLARGFTYHIDRRRQAQTGEEVMREFPLLSISLAGVSTAKRDFADYFDFFNVVSEVKKEVKKEVKSSYLIQD